MSKAWGGGFETAVAQGPCRRARRQSATAGPGGNNGLRRRRIPDVCTGRADTVHHKLGAVSGDDPRYLEATCAACNLHIGEPRPAHPF